MRGRAIVNNKNSSAKKTLPARRSSQRTAKTTALSAISNTINNRKRPPKKHWKAKKAVEVTPQHDLSIPFVVAPPQQAILSSWTPNKTTVLAKLEVATPQIHSSINGNAGLKSLTVTTKFTSEKLPFPLRLFEMVEAATIENPSLCRWSKDGRCIEIDSKNPELLTIIRKYFSHSRWLSFTRQLNNYGFTSLIPRQYRTAPKKSQWRIYHHPNFYRDISDPSALVALLPYLPGKRKRSEKKAPKRSTKRAKLTRNNQSAPFVKTVTPPLTTIQSTRGLQVTASSGMATTRAAMKSRKAALQVTPASKATVTKKKSKKASQGKTAVTFLKTPSPRNPKAKYMSSPPPLSHYLPTKSEDDATNNNTAATVAKKQPPNESPLPSSLLTVSFVMTPSSLQKNTERTPRTSNLSSSQSSPSSQDGFRMLSWAAHALESPPPSMEFIRSMVGCSPLVSSNKKKKTSSLSTAVHRCYNQSSPSTLSTSPAAIRSNDSIGPSPLSFRGHHHQDTEVDLELLRNCLEDVFVATSSGSSASNVGEHTCV